MTALTKKKQNYDYCNETLKMEETARAIYLAMGERLYRIREGQLYLPSWTSWQEYCMEFRDISQPSISKMISVYEKFMLEFGFTVDELVPAGGWTKLYEIGQQVETKAEAKQWIEEASVLSRDDLKKNLTEAKTGISMKDCAHPETYTITICKCCGDKIENHE